jgi:hypothetical protein
MLTHSSRTELFPGGSGNPESKGNLPICLVNQLKVIRDIRRFLHTKPDLRYTALHPRQHTGFSYRADLRDRHFFILRWKKPAPIFAFCWVFLVRFGKCMCPENPLPEARYGLLYEVHSGRILANGLIIGRILHWNRNRAFCGVFRETFGFKKGNPGPQRAYFTSYPLCDSPLVIRENQKGFLLFVPSYSRWTASLPHLNSR